MNEYVVCTEDVNANLELSGDSWDQLETDSLEEANEEYMRLIKEIEQGFHRHNRNSNRGIGVSILIREENGNFSGVKHYAHISKTKRGDQDGEIKSMLPYEYYLQRKIWTPEEITRKVLEEIDSYDKEIQEGYYDIYITDDEYGIRLVDSGMDYNGESYDCYKNVGTVDSRYVSINIDDLWV